jgi:hypothetical protein
MIKTNRLSLIIDIGRDISKNNLNNPHQRALNLNYKGWVVVTAAGCDDVMAILYNRSGLW